MREALWYFLLFVIGMGIYFGVDSYMCKEKVRMMGKTHSYGCITGCMILHKGEWVPLSSYRSLD